MKAAIYARFSTENQRDESIEDQVGKCRFSATEKDFEVLDQFIFTDYAMSGTSENRPGLQALISACTAGLVQAVFVDDSSRLSRDNLYFNQLLAIFEAYGVVLYSVSDGLNSSDPNSRMAYQFRGIMNESYVTDLRARTRRGQEGQIDRGYIAGSLGYGYKSVKSGKTRRDKKGRLRAEGSVPEIISEEAEIIRRVFNEYANGKSLRKIVQDLNLEKVPTRKGSWNSSTISKMLENKKFIGKYIWGKYKSVKNPLTRKKTRKSNPANQVREMDMPSLRIISDELWDQVQQRLTLTEGMHPTTVGKKGFPGKQTSYVKSNPPQLLSGALRCSCCSGSMVQVSGKSGGYYGCQNHQKGVCSNETLIRREILEDHFMNAVFEKVLVPEYLDSIYEKAFEVVKKEFAHIPEELSRKKLDLQKAQRQVKKLIEFLVDGEGESVRQALEETEANIRGLKSDIECLNKALQDNVVRPSKDWIGATVAELKSLLQMKTEKSALVLRKILGEEITLTPEVSENGKKFYKATTKIGTLSLLGKSEKGSNSFVWWRWRESNSRPRSFQISHLHV